MDKLFDLAKQKKSKQRQFLYAMTFGFVIVALLVAFLDSLVSYSAIIFVPFLVVPFFIAVQMMYLQLENEPFSSKLFYRIFRVGMSPMLRSSYRTIKNALFAVLINFVLSSIILGIFYLIPNYHQFILDLFEVIQANYGDTLNDALNTFAKANLQQYNTVFYITNAISYGVSFMYFAYKMLHNALYALCKNAASLPNGKNQPIFNEVFSKYKKVYYKNYYKHQWYKVLLVPIFYTLGALVAYFTDKLALSNWFGSSFAITAIGILLPDLLGYQEQAYIYFFNELSSKNFINMQKIYSDIENNLDLTKEQHDALQNLLNQLKETVEEEKKKHEKEKEDKDNNKSNQDWLLFSFKIIMLRQ